MQFMNFKKYSLSFALLLSLILGQISCGDSNSEPPSLSIERVQCPSGKFPMGSTENELERSISESPQRMVTLSAFKISKYEITFEQYDAFCDSTGRTKPNDAGWGRGNRPVINVSWHDAQAFAEWMGPGYRLPTEAEWEYACRGNTVSPFFTGYCISSSQANFDANFPYSGCAIEQALGQTTPVGTFPPNPFGIYDMHGNVWEWCSDWHGPYTTSETTNPQGPSTGSKKVVRGGSWQYGAGYCRSASRSNALPEIRGNNIGFRLVVPN
jgi:formylglycine-generating enzyme required for sulfatase activity